MKITQLKGGSLSSTALHDDGQTKFIRKSINTTDNREYGYVRWYSQLKKLQRFASTGLFPKVLRVGTTDNGAYFDIEYLDGYRDIKNILSGEALDADYIERINEAVWYSFSKLHHDSYTPLSGSAKLYFKEEVVQKLSDALKFEQFAQFYEQNTYEYNGQITHGIQNYLNELKNFFDETQFLIEENIHGNPTLENMMYSFEENKVKFVDPYEESCIDSRLLDYSQVLQCSRSHYGFINDREVTVDGTTLSFHGDIPGNFKMFNRMFEAKIDPKDRMLIDVLEATQFIRMLPFKLAAGETDKAKFFYVHACHLLGKVFA